MMIQEKQKEIKRYENQIINIQKIINANVGDNDLSGDTDNYQRIRQNKINLSSSKKMLDVVNNYITKKPTEISILSSENINHIFIDRPDAKYIWEKYNISINSKDIHASIQQLCTSTSFVNINNHHLVPTTILTPIIL